ncbi:MAG: CDP-glycerol glycerophosphotransferase family protein [Clostridia bacterium]|nr:CDP-glycerol glycerophosphotransferase family protein [Clostridia bacterium]
MKNLLKKILNVKTRRKILVFLNRTWCAFCRILPMRNVVLFYTIRADGRLLDNAKAVYDALDAKKVVFAHKLPHSVKIKPLAYYYLLTSRVIVTDDYVRYMRAIKLRKGQKLFQIWHACGAFKKFGLDAPSLLTPAEERSTHSQYSAVAVTSEACRKSYAGAFGISEDICLPIGLPRTDKLLRDAPEMRNGIFEKHPQFAGKKIYLYCPTFRENNGVRKVYNSEIDWSEMSKAMNDDEIFVICRHPIMDYRFENGEYPNVIDLTGESTLALTAACDVMITDYSSVIYDACLLDVPTVFYCPDYKEYERGFYLDFPDGLPGDMITNGAELLEKVRGAKENPPAERIQKFKSEQIDACDGHSTERAVEIIKNWLK